MESDLSCYETTYSEDERYEIYMKEKKRAEMETKEQNERERELDFQEYYNNYKEAPESVFNLDGINFLKFNHRKIKFIFVPSNITKYISKKSKFICILKYNINQWYIGNNTLPCNCKTSVYRKYCFNINYNITDENIIEVLCGIYEHLRVWCQEHETFRLDKRKRYLSGEEMFLDSEDEELFLNEDEIKELHEKREAVLKRMIPPSPPRKKRRHAH